MSLPWAALLKRLSIRLQPHGPSHLIRSQWKPVAPCHHSYSTGPGCNCDSHRSTALDTLRKPFRCKREDIMWLMYNSVSHGWHCTWLERRDSARERDTWKSRVLFTFFIGYIQSWKPHPRFYQSNWQPIHLNYTWMRMRTITALQKLESLTLLRVCLSPSFTRSVSLPLPYHLSSFLFHLPLLVFTCQWLLRKCLSRFFFSLSFFVCYLHVSGFPYLMVEMKVICFVTVRPFYQLLLSSILVSEYWWQWNQGAVKKFCKLSR